MLLLCFRSSVWCTLFMISREILGIGTGEPLSAIRAIDGILRAQLWPPDSMQVAFLPLNQTLHVSDREAPQLGLQADTVVKQWLSSAERRFRKTDIWLPVCR
jgi:hypothetical protein